jgi:[glutamine synthetase] adenylyltransferase / [glutamine synthetase]-adenylyl-L-tyrosine phosphorylase
LTGPKSRGKLADRRKPAPPSPIPIFGDESLPMPFFTSARLPAPFDPVMAANGLERWREATRGADDESLINWMIQFSESETGEAFIKSICGNSPYLGQILTREPAWVQRFVTEGPDATFADLMSELRSASPASSMDALMTRLRVVKRRAALLIAVCDIADIWTVERVTAALSETAEVGVRLACDHLLLKAAEAGRIILPDLSRPSEGSGLIVLGMGKLGARELNYSSDIDLIVLYDDAVVQMKDPDRMAQTFIKIARDLVKMMDERTKDGYVFRTDLRLRPDPGATPPAVSVSAAEVYYGSVGQNWERAAMIKARVVGGDEKAAANFLNLLKPFIWRRNLDFAAIQDIHSIKRQINAHKGHRVRAVQGHDIKVGRGGIREIEFFAQTQQLIFGGRDPSLRISPTLAAIRALCDASRVPEAAVEELSRAYRYLRRVEHRIQMIDDRQTHKVPDSEQGVAHLATFLGYAAPDDFRHELMEMMGLVEDRYAELFEEAPQLAPAGNLVFTGTDDDPATLTTLQEMGFAEPSRVIAVVSGWHRGRYRATRSARARELLTELTPSLLRELARTANPDAALMHMDNFLSRLPAGVGVFSLFCANPWLLPLVAEIMGGAPGLAETLSRHPALLDGVLSPTFFDPLPTRAALIADYARVVGPASHLEEALLSARRWTNDHRFQAGAHMLRNATDGERCGPFLADLADVALTDLAGRVEDEFAVKHGRMPGGAWVIVALGKLGSGQLTITSDIDLIVIYDAPEEVTASDGSRPLSPPEYYARLAQRLTVAITAQMADGRLYEVDMRLRPSGNAGPLATALSAFVKYQHSDAWTWEHMALTRARVVTGDAALAQKVKAVIAEVLQAPRDPDKLLFDVADMRRRIEGEFPAKSVWNLKYVRGGLIDIEFVAQYLQLRHAHAHPEILSVNMAAALERARDLGLLAADAAGDLLEALRTWRRTQGYLRLAGDDDPAAHADAPAVVEGIARAAFPDDPPTIDFAQLEAKVAAVAAAAHRRHLDIITEPAARITPPT